MTSLPATVAGSIIRAPAEAGYQIVINSVQSAEIQRFTAAYEPGQFMFHRRFLDIAVGDTLGYRAQGSGFPIRGSAHTRRPGPPTSRSMG